jgi:ubiquinone biosynthesis UbiH/UbiF/VisC/COQ6 family hydroxylase
MSTQEIIILGGGIVGKTAALAFSQKGLKVLHIAANFGDKSNTNSSNSEKVAWNSRVYAISHSSEQLFQDLQIWQAIDPSRRQVVEQMRIYGDSGELADGIHFSAFEANLPKLAYIIESQQIEEALDLATTFSKFITRHEASFESISIDEGQAIVKTNIGNFKAPLVIAADGANSLIRTQVGIEISQDLYEHTAVIGNFACENQHLRTAHQWFLDNGDVLALLPLPNKKVSMVWSTSEANAAYLVDLYENNPDLLCQFITSQAQGLPLQTLGKLQLLNQIKTYPLKRQRAKQFIGPTDEPKVVLLGDAAHVMHPLAGQGLNLGLRDIRDLVRIITEKENFRSINDRVLLRRYERARVADVDAILGVTHHLHRLFMRNDFAIKWLRNTGMRFLNQQSNIKMQLITKALE